ncbi:hypothetical protein PCA10_53260 [Metapseudomonas resinovorans NBRC 106553]|uniref:Amine oxidase domain-containing protein n=2 Tax=Metapseudomonas resinovorans TaxID=53412 RepID=S6AXB9_METRE|nr:hypothetical protein PCA10_53260 [Pseudomonas resinovorans NBRC 106553]
MVVENKQVDLLVVGGGAAGLSAALTAERRGLSCQVLEAQERLGGRLWSIRSDADAMWVDLGGQLVNGDMSRVLRIARDAGLHLAPVAGTGAVKTVLADDRVYRDLARNSEGWMDMLLTPELVARAQAATSAPTLSEVLDWLNLDQQEAQLIRSTICEMFGHPAEALDGLGAILETQTFRSQRSDIEFQFRRGFSGIIEQLASSLRQAPLLQTPVHAISRHGERIIARTDAGEWSAAHLVIAVPPPVVRHIQLDLDDVDSHLTAALDSFVGGELIKFILTFDTPFWRYTGLSGQVEYLEPAGLNLVDGSLDDGSHPRLVAFLGGPLARQWAGQSAGWRRQALLDLMAKAFGEQVYQVRSVHEGNWVDHRWCAGAYNSHIRAGGMSDACEYLASWGKGIAFAGAEYAASYRGFVEGALDSGEKAVLRLLDAAG